MNFLFFGYLLLICVIKFCNGSIKIGDPVETNLNLHQYIDEHFMNISFKNCLYHFSVNISKISVLAHSASYNITLQRSVDNGKAWVSHKNILKKSYVIKIHLNAVYVINNEIVLFFYSRDNFVMRSKDGLNWGEPSRIKIDTLLGGSSFFSSYPLDFFGINEKGKDKNLIICSNNYMNFYLKPKDVKYECAFSSDNGTSWIANKFIHIDETGIEEVNSRKIFFFRNMLRILAYTDSQNIYFICQEEDIEGFRCQRKSFANIDDYSLIHMDANNDESGTKGYLLIVLKKEDKIYVAVSYDGEEAFVLREIIKGDKYEFIFIDEKSVALFTEMEEIVKVTEINNFPEIKVGCGLDITKNKNEQDEVFYSNSFHLTKNGSFSCTMTHLGSVKSEDGLYKSFFVQLEKDAELKENCFAYSLLDNNENIGSKKKESVILKVKNWIKNIKTNKGADYLNEIEFFYPVELNNYLFNRMVVQCSTKDEKYNINFIFNSLKGVTEISTTVNDSEGFYETNTVFKNVNKTIKELSSVPSINDETKKIILRSDEVITVVGCPNLEYSQTIDLPKGSYHLPSFKECTNNYLISEYIPENTFFQYTKRYNDVEEGIKWNIQQNENIKNVYVGVDLTDSSFNYANRHGSIETNGKVYVIVRNNSFEQKLGLICPVTNANDFHCFDNVYNEEDKLVDIQSLFGNEKIFTIPQRRLVNKRMVAIESLVILNKNIFNFIEKNGKTIKFYCECYLNKHNVRVIYVLLPPDSTEYIQKEIKEDGTVLTL